MFVFFLLCITLCPFQFCNHLEEEEKAGCFAVIVLPMYYYYRCYVALPRGAVVCSAVCDCDMSYSFTFCWFSYVAAQQQDLTQHAPTAIL